MREQRATLVVLAAMAGAAAAGRPVEPQTGTSLDQAAAALAAPLRLAPPAEIFQVTRRGAADAAPAGVEDAAVAGAVKGLVCRAVKHTSEEEFACVWAGV